MNYIIYHPKRETVDYNELTMRNRMFFSIILLTALLTVMTANAFSQELERVRGDFGYWGYIDKSSRETIIPCEYLSAKDFSEGLAAVKLLYEWGFIDKAGTKVISFKYSRAESFSEGLAAVKLNGKWGFIDKNGTEIVPCTYNMRNSPELERERVMALEREKASKLERSSTEQHQEITLSLTGNAPDIIMLKDGNEIKAKVTEITLSEIKYKAFEYLEGPTRIVEKKDVFLIIYENGTREIFNTTPETKISLSKRQNVTDCAKKTAFGLDIGIGGGKSSEIFSSSLGIRVMHHYNPYFGIDFFKINWITDVAVYNGLWTMKLQLMSGFRVNSPAFYKCMSVYGAFRLGYGMHVATGYYGGLLKGVTDFKGLCLETELGVNITSAFFVGFSYNYHKGFGDYFSDSPWQHTFSTRFGFNFGK